MKLNLARLRPTLLLFSFSLASLACSSSTPASSAEADAAPAAPPSTEAAEGGPADAGPRSVNGCTEADFAAFDRTAEEASRTIEAPPDARPAQFSPHCMRVRVGQTVTWHGALDAHRMEFVLRTDDGGGGEFVGTVGEPDGSPDVDTLAAHQPGTILFSCGEHPTIMFGAVKIVP